MSELVDALESGKSIYNDILALKVTRISQIDATNVDSIINYPDNWEILDE